LFCVKIVLFLKKIASQKLNLHKILFLLRISVVKKISFLCLAFLKKLNLHE